MGSASSRIDSARSDEELIAAIRRGDIEALEDYFAYFLPFLEREATRAGVQPALREQESIDCLDDVLLYLLDNRARVPRSLLAYVTASLRHQVMNRQRDERRRASWTMQAAREGGAEEIVVTQTLSEGTVRASAGPPHTAAHLSPALRHFAAAITRELSPAEETLLAWLAVSRQRDVAEAVGSSYTALRSQVHRLRRRLQRVSAKYLEHADEPDRRAVSAFLRRAGRDPMGRPNEPPQPTDSLHARENLSGSKTKREPKRR